MRFTNVCACSIVMIQCGAMAAGSEPQHMFGAGYEWMWWIFAAWWFGAALSNLVEMFE